MPLLLLQVKYDQDGNIVVRELRDYLGALTNVERVDPHGRPLPGASDAEIAVMQVGAGANAEPVHFHSIACMTTDAAVTRSAQVFMLPQRRCRVAVTTLLVGLC